MRVSVDESTLVTLLKADYSSDRRINLENALMSKYRIIWTRFICCRRTVLKSGLFVVETAFKPSNNRFDKSRKHQLIFGKPTPINEQKNQCYKKFMKSCLRSSMAVRAMVFKPCTVEQKPHYERDKLLLSVHKQLSYFGCMQ